MPKNRLLFFIGLSIHCLFSNLLMAQCVENNHGFDQIQFQEEALFLVSRAMPGKSNTLIRPFLRYDTSITHVGIAFIENGKLWVQHISNEGKAGESAQRREPLDSFWKNKQHSAGALWRFKNESLPLRSIKQILDSLWKEKLNFDYDFQLNNGNRFYCSEFCALVLMLINPAILACKPSVYELNDPFLIQFFKSRFWIGFPPDFFRYAPSFRPVLSW